MGAINGIHVGAFFFLMFFATFCVEERIGSLRVTKTTERK